VRMTAYIGQPLSRKGRANSLQTRESQGADHPASMAGLSVFGALAD